MRSEKCSLEFYCISYFFPSVNRNDLNILGEQNFLKVHFNSMKVMEPRSLRFLNDGNDLELTSLIVISPSLGMAPH